MSGDDLVSCPSDRIWCWSTRQANLNRGKERENDVEGAKMIMVAVSSAPRLKYMMMLWQCSED